MTKNAKRREKFCQIATAGDRDYLSGREAAFEPRSGDKGHRDGFHVQVKYGPQFRTPQWERVTK